jgi:hypothetical protein
MLLRSPSIDRAARHQLADLWGGRRPPQAPLARPWALWAARLSNGGYSFSKSEFFCPKQGYKNTARGGVVVPLGLEVRHITV